MTIASLVLYKTPKAQIEALLSSVLPSCAEKLIIVDNSPDDRWWELESRLEKIPLHVVGYEENRKGTQ